MRRGYLLHDVIRAVALVLLVACGAQGRGDDGNDAVDAKVLDAAPMIDAAPMGTSSIGQACTPGMTPQANCPAGYECLSLTNGNGAWCSRTCVRGPGNDTCAQGYTGPGVAVCIYDIMDTSSTRQFCGVICQAASCPTCNGTCPATLMCTQNLMGTGGTVTGKACI